MTVSFARPDDAGAIVAALAEAAAWMAVKANGRPVWNPALLGEAWVAPRIAASEFVIARVDGEVVGACLLSRADPEFWPEDIPGEAAYLHKIAVRRAFTGGLITPELVGWCAQTAADWGCKALKLDCDPEIGKIYARLGFTRLDEKLIKPMDRAPFLVDRFYLML